MARKRLAILLSLVLMVLVAAGLAGFGYLKLSAYPFLFDLPPYRLAANGYLGEFQPIFLRQVSEAGTAYLLVLYRNPQGKWVNGKVLVGGAVSGQEPLAWLPYASKDDPDPAASEPAGYRYPFFPDQRLKVMFLVAKPGAETAELGEICKQNPRVCQISKMVVAGGTLSELVAQGGLEPKLPVRAVGVNQELVGPLPAGTQGASL
jgi:hypothetical protein